MILAMFFVTFCSCPIKKFIRIELGLPVAPISDPVSKTGDHDANNIKDYNINKHKFCQKIVLSVKHQAPNPLLPHLFFTESPSSSVHRASVAFVQEQKTYSIWQYYSDDIPLLYLQHSRLQV